MLKLGTEWGVNKGGKADEAWEEDDPKFKDGSGGSSSKEI
jgi:hypothetical protein